jgi:DNA recombination protein RmuC
VEYEVAADEEIRASALKKLIASVRAHAEDLAGKHYQSAAGLNAHELVLMFIPIEGVAAVVQKNDNGLFDWCWKRKIVMVSPSSLYMTMKTVASIWRYERQNEKAQDIAQQAGQLYDKLVGFVDDLNNVSQKLQSAWDAHAEAMKKLATGKGNALSRAEKLRTLGVASKKDLPVVLAGADRHTIEVDDEGPAPPEEAIASRLLDKPAEVG